MKIQINQKVLLNALEHGAVAALSEEAQNDNSGFSLMTRAVRITVEGNKILFESATPNLASKYVVPIDPINNIKVVESGSAMIPAKELYDWVSKQSDALIGINLKKFDTPKVIKGDDSEADAKNSIKKIGDFQVASKDETGKGNKWQLDCYDTTCFPAINLNVKPSILFSIPTEQLFDGLKYTMFSSLSKCPDRIYDSLIFQVHNNFLNVAASDTTRCAVYTLNKATEISNEFMLGKSRVLIPNHFLKLIVKLFDKTVNTSVYYDDSKDKIYISQPNYDIRMSVPEKNIARKFPSVSGLLDKQYDEFCNINKNILLNRLSSASIVNKSSVLFAFVKDLNLIKIQSVSESGLSPSISEIAVENIKDNRKSVWAISHIVDVTKAVKDDLITVCLPKDDGSFKITSINIPEFKFYSMTIKNHKYQI